MKTLITGAAGFVGTHLCEYLLHHGDELHGTFLDQTEFDRLSASLRKQVVFHQCDLSLPEQIRKIMEPGDFERVYHLAAISSVHQSWQGQDLVIRVNLYGWINLMEALRQYCPNARILMVSSGEVYGVVPENRQPIDEFQPLRPINPYADSKAAQEMFCYQYIHRYQLQVVIVRPFNHTGPRQAPSFVCPDFAKQIAAIEQGKREAVISVGNLEARRDFSDVRDVVRAYHLALETCAPGMPVNVASGNAWSIQQMLDMLLQFSTVPIEIRQDPQRLRPSDVPLMLGDYTRLHRQTGWQPEIPFEDTLQSVLNYWREFGQKNLIA
ncbi:MAG: GDP-mannose 4,6-dehydratase [Candidatus Vecturithrix sp.]|nr:GDP-mannose 4,6-dehydratase [Candidatus Vecturithrix sp.]